MANPGDTSYFSITPPSSSSTTNPEELQFQPQSPINVRHPAKVVEPIVELEKKDESNTMVAQPVASVVDNLKLVKFSRADACYRLGVEIGHGKYGNIHVALPYNPQDDDKARNNGRRKRRVAPKFVIKSTSDGNVFKYEMMAYRRIASAINGWLYESDENIDFSTATSWHPLICRLYDSSTNCLFDSRKQRMVQQFHLLLENLPAGSLDELVFKHHPQRSMHINEAIFYIAELSEALLFLHDNGVLHHDIKPNNILVRRNGHIVLADFGLACTSTGRVAPFPGPISCKSSHMPPEVRLFASTGARKIWHAVDWYSVGILLYRLVSRGNYPVNAGLDRLLLKSPDKFHFVDPNFTEAGNELAKGLLFPNPSLRLGGHLELGGRQVLSHPDFLRCLLVRNRWFDKAFSTSVDSHRLSLLSELDPSLVQSLKQASRRRVGPLAVGDSVPEWFDQLRNAIKNQRLTPPFHPSYGV